MAAKKLGKPSLAIVRSSPLSCTSPPRKLGNHGLTLWQTIMSEYQISDSGGLEILYQICAATDRAERQREIIDDEGETITIKGVLRAHPLLREELANRAFICRGLQRLGLNVEAVKPVGRPGKGY
ncbi:hypothetical protein ACMA5K_05720 [Bradyrhizobium diazoefficiens]|uniref:hypothetical protein n=1 Tax=Bradyrhizobium diazoefficiens TaxID=1355477 RepID=UPI0015B454E8|nr:hypothetical protein [Bradyrhizobium diazoefficiens]QLD40513.1 hypothetical protein HUW42_05660 [Bradyrhizobium diazoefficiens]